MKSIVTHPYEFLVRFAEGKLAGAHVQFIDYIYEDGKLISHLIGEPQPVEEGGKFPFSGLLKQVNIAAITRVVKLEAKVEALQDEIDSLKP